MSGEPDLDNLIESLLARIAADPSNLALHRELREAALWRTAGGGRASGIWARWRPLPRDPLRRMIRLERAWSLDPGNVDLLVGLTRAIDAFAASGPGADCEPVLRWLRQVLASAQSQS